MEDPDGDGRIPVEGGGHRVADWIAGVRRRVRDLVAVEGGRHADLVGRGIENDAPARFLSVGQVHHLDGHGSEVRVAIAQLDQVRAQQRKAVKNRVDTVRYAGTG